LEVSVPRAAKFEARNLKQIVMTAYKHDVHPRRRVRLDFLAGEAWLFSAQNRPARKSNHTPRRMTPRFLLDNAGKKLYKIFYVATFLQVF